jgi:hypothetical protein
MRYVAVSEAWLNVSPSLVQSSGLLQRKARRLKWLGLVSAIGRMRPERRLFPERKISTH